MPPRKFQEEQGQNYVTTLNNEIEMLVDSYYVCLLYTSRLKVMTRTNNGFEISQEDLHPVSYTHLDVYKRQPISSAASWARRRASSARGVNLFSIIKKHFLSKGVVIYQNYCRGIIAEAVPSADPAAWRRTRSPRPLRRDAAASAGRCADTAGRSAPAPPCPPAHPPGPPPRPVGPCLLYTSRCV